MSASLKLRLIAHCLRHKLPFQVYRKSAEYLECYSYIEPRKRETNSFLLDWILEQVRIEGNSSALFIAWKQVDMVSSALTDQEQEELWMLLKEQES